MDSRSGSEGANRKVKGTLHWLSAAEAVPCEYRLYEPILSEEVEEEAQPAEAALDEDEAEVAEAAPAADFMSRLNPNSLTVDAGLLRAVRRPTPRIGTVLPVPAHRLFLQGQGFHRSQACVQPHRGSQGRLQGRSQALSAHPGAAADRRRRLQHEREGRKP